LEKSSRQGEDLCQFREENFQTGITSIQKELKEIVLSKKSSTKRNSRQVFFTQISAMSQRQF
jgi:hypothetical protein